MAVGRISGPLLKANLVRDGVDLAFETDLLYLDVTNSRVGINTTTPQQPLDVNGIIRTTDMTVTNQLDVGPLSIFGNTVQFNSDAVFVAPSGNDPVLYHTRLVIDDLQITGNTISTEVSNSNLELRANGTGRVNIQSNTQINGNLDVTGNITATGDVTIGGNIIIGDEITDSIVINAGIASNLVPDTDNTYNLGSPSFKWKTVYANELYIETLDLTNLKVGYLNFSGNSIVSDLGTDIVLSGTGSAGSVVLGNFAFNGNTITNRVAGAVSEIIPTGSGYVKIQGTNGLVIPSGTSGDRPDAYAEVGMIRFNTDSKAVEVWNGITWANPAGASGAVTEIQANELAATFALALG